MSKHLIYLDYKEALEVYAKTVSASAGGIEGVKNEGGIRKVLDFVQNDLYYPTFADKLTYLVFGLCTGHYFEDSNKRVALTAGMWFLLRNGYHNHSYRFMQCLEAVIYHVASGRIDKELLGRVIQCFMDTQDYPESLKLEIISAIDVW